MPAGWTDVEAAGLPETFFTVWSNVFDRGRLQLGRDAAGARRHEQHRRHGDPVGQAFGATVIATAGSDEVQMPASSWARTTINYRTQDFSAETRRLTGERGADVILDMVAGPYVPRELEYLADDGRLVIIALQGGARAGWISPR